MTIQETSITVNYNKIDGIKRAYYNNEEILKEFFNEATVLPVPDDAPVEIPRIIIKTLNEHAQLNISPVATTFLVRYDSGYEENWKECAEYIKKRMAPVFKLLNTLTNNNYNYIGLVSNVIYDEVKSGSAEKLTNTLLNSQKIKDIYDIYIKYTFTENENMFVNIILQNARIFKEGTVFDTPGALRISEQVSESIGAIIDINDRYGFNNCENYQSSCEKLEELMSCMSNIIENKLAKLIEDGEY